MTGEIYSRQDFLPDKTQLEEQLIFIEEEARVVTTRFWDDTFQNNRSRPRDQQSYLMPLIRKKDLTLTLYWGRRHPSSRTGAPRFTIVKHEKLQSLYTKSPKWQHKMIKETEAELAYLRRQIKTIGKASIYLTQLRAHVRRNYRRQGEVIEQEMDQLFTHHENYYPGA